MNKGIIHSVFENQVEKSPDRIAVEEEGKNITYSQLNNRANKLGHFLLSKFKQKNAVVAVLLPAEINLVVALLAIFKSGGMYLPIDVRFSEIRLGQILQQCVPEILIASEQMLSQLPESLDLSDVNIIFIEENDDDLPELVENLNLDISPDDNNYIFYTSGSTGEGKAILGIHNSLSHFIHWEMKEFDVDETFRISQLASFTFDASLRDIFVPLCTGATLCIPSADTKDNIAALIAWLETERITLVHCVPSMLRLINKELKSKNSLNEYFSHMKYILVAGEMLFHKDVQLWTKATNGKTEMVNLYGCTETTLLKTFHRVKEIDEDPAKVVHVGKPISNTAIVIINDGVLCSPREIGDVYVKTPFLSAGYYKNQMLTDAAFVQNPLVDEHVDIVYKTGDQGRYLHDNNIEILNRSDGQVKINGIRVELSEVLHAVLGIDGVEHAIVITHKNEDMLNELVCYYTGSILVDELWESLRNLLNENLIPGHYIHLDVFPTNINGKIDSKQLPLPGTRTIEEINFETCKDGGERILEQIFKEVLRIDNDLSRNASFFQIGGNSLTSILLISRLLKQFKVIVAIRDLYLHPTIKKLHAFINSSPENHIAEITPVLRQDNYELSYAQKRLWILHQMENAKSVYNISSGWTINGVVNIKALEKTFGDLVSRHEVLRTTFKCVDGEPKQIINKVEEKPFSIIYTDLSTRTGLADCSDSIIHNFIASPFDLEDGPLFKVKVIKNKPDEHILLLVLHHIIFDGWSMQVMLEEIIRSYNDHLNGLFNNLLPPLKIQYKDYCAWSNGKLASEKMSMQKYWLNQLKGELPVLELPTDNARPLVKSYKGGNCVLRIDKKLTKSINQICQLKETSLYIFLIASINALLYRYTQQKDIIIGTAAAGREHSALENQLGFYVNTLAIRTIIDEKENFDLLLQKVRGTVFDALDNQYYPFDLLLEDLHVGRDLSRSPLFEVIVVLQNIELPGNSDEEMERMEITPYPLKSENTKYDLVFTFYEYDDQITLVLDYSKDIFEHTRIERLTQHLKKLFQSFVENSNVLLDEINILSEAEVQKVFYDFNNYHLEYPKNKPVITLFEEQVVKTPNHQAVIFGEKVWSYDELNKRSNQFAHRLLSEFDIERESVIAIMIDRSDILIIAILGVLKCGAAYLPIDPSYPDERVHHILTDSQAKILIKDNDFPKHKIRYNTPMVTIGKYSTGKHSTENLAQVTRSSENLAYVIYTSGSSGSPKGVMVENRSLVNLCKWHIASFSLNDTSRATLYAGVGFDASAWELWPYLLSGGCIYPLTGTIKFDMKMLTGFLCKNGITHSFLPTLIVEQLSEKETVLPSDIFILTGGDKLSKYKTNNDFQIVNNYGPTEATVVTTSIILNERDAKISIGKPISNTTVLILDDHLNLVPPGISGELFIAGDSLARGYLNNPKLTDEKFIKNPFKNVNGTRLFATGDKARWLDNGNIEFLGRKDQQVKIRGYRIELGEIEQALSCYDAIESSLVLQIERQHPILAAFYLSKHKLEITDLKNHLARLLPPYMIPASFVQLESFPLTPNGKIDLEELKMKAKLPLEDKLMEADPVVKKIMNLWTEVLNSDDFGIHSNFFEIGGHSLKAMQIISRVYSDLGVAIVLEDFFLHQTAADMALLVKSKPTGIFVDIEPVEEQQHYPLSYAQSRLWIISASQNSNNVYNICTGYIFKDQLNKEAFKKAFNTIIRRYDILRTTFKIIDGESRQQVRTYEEFSKVFNCLDFEITDNDLENTRPLLERVALTIFNIETGPLLKGVIFELNDGKSIFVLNIHHLIIDGWSMTILLEELGVLYNKFCKKNEGTLPKLGIQYKDFVIWNKAILQRHSKEALNYWLAQFKETLKPLDLEYDFKKPSKKSFEGKDHIFTIDAEKTEVIRSLSKAQNTTVFMFLTATVKVLLHKISKGQRDIVIGTPTAGRTHTSLENQIGFFINTLALKSHLDPQESFLTFLNKVKTTVINGFKYEYFPFEQLVEELSKLKNGNVALFNVFVTLHNTTAQISEKVQNISVDRLYLENSASQFDLSFDFWETDDEIVVKLNYATDLFKSETVSHISETYLRLLKRIFLDSTEKISKVLDFDILKESLLKALNKSKSFPSINKISRASKQIN